MNRIVMIVLILLAGSASAALVTENLIIHLDAGSLSGLNDGDSVTTWADSATTDTVDGSVTVDGGYGSPTYETNEINGQPVLRFVRADQDVMVSATWNLPDPALGATIFVVCTGGSSGSVERVAQIGAAAGTASHMIGVDVSTNTSGCRYNNGYSLSFSGSNPVTAGAYHIGIRQIAQGGRHDSLYYAVDDLDAEPLNCINPSNTITFDSANNHISIGSGVDTNGVWYPDFYNGDLAEILVYNAQLTTIQITQTAEYLSSKYGLSFGVSAILVDEGDGKTQVREGGYTDQVTISMNNNPGSYPVTIQTEYFMNPGQILVTPAELTFNSANWQTPQSFTVSAADDDYMERAIHDTQLELTVTADPASAYYGTSLNNIRVDIEDNDCGSWGFSPADRNLDCVVDLEDFSYFALDWMECSMPDAGCQPD